MPIQIMCPACRRPLRVPDDMIGQLVKCPSCLSEFSASTEMPTPQLEPAFRAAAMTPPPVRLPPRPEPLTFEDEWEDDFNLLRRGIDRETAREDVFYPAVGLTVTGFAGLILGMLFLGLGMNRLSEARGPNDETNAYGMLVQALFSAGMGLLILLGGVWMMKLKRYSLVVAVSVIALLPCFSPCCLIGLPVGVWSLAVLTRGEVRRAFS